ncbi:MAG TPA: CPBP family intramembrane glutamic endopeptidase [Vicinamibacterales bacterium]|jgi:membrane protease YdiL (CAAX protease family)
MSIAHLLDAIWAIAILGGVPIQSLATRQTLEQQHPTRLQIYASAVTTLAILAGVTLGVDLSGARQGLAAFGRALPPATVALWAAITFIVGAALWFGFLLLQKLRRDIADPRIVAILPFTALERFLWIGVSIAAGIAEEYVYRGFCFSYLSASTGSIAAAGVLVTIGFGLAHAYQGRAATVKAGVLGAVLLMPVLVTGALLPSIIAHAAIDVLSGLTMRNLLLRWNLIQFGEWIGERDERP